jgi:hypothetical protein
MSFGWVREVSNMAPTRRRAIAEEPEVRKRLLFLSLAAAVLAVAVAATPSGGQAPTPVVEEVSGGAYGIFGEARSDLLVPPSPPAIRALVQAAADEDAAAASAGLTSVGADPAAASASVAPEAVVADVGPIPEVTLPPEGGGPISDSASSIDFDGVLVGDSADVTTEGALGPDGFAAATAALSDYDLLGLLGGGAILTECLADLDGTAGTTELIDAGGIISGPFETNPAPNTPSPFNVDITFPVDADGTTLTVQYLTTLNEQITNGTELTVNGLHTFLSVRVDPEGPGVGDAELVIFEIEAIASQSRCGVVEGVVDPIDPVDPVGPIPGDPSFAG